jgi:hypothetical protein
MMHARRHPTFEARPMTTPLALTDRQLDIVLAAAEPLQRWQRPAFLEAVSLRLRGKELGDGLVSRVCRDMQRQFLVPPDLSRATGTSKYR